MYLRNANALLVHRLKNMTLYLTLTLRDDLDLSSKNGLTTMNKHVKYESAVTNHSKVITNNKEFLKYVILICDLDRRT